MKPRKQRKAPPRRATKWDLVFKLLRECGASVEAGNVETAKQSAMDARSAAMKYIRVARFETSMAMAVRDIIDKHILHHFKTSGSSTVAFAYIDGAIACIKRVVAREATQRAVSRYQARLRKSRPRTRTWSEVDAVARQAIRDVRAELGDEAFS